MCFFNLWHCNGDRVFVIVGSITNWKLFLSQWRKAERAFMSKTAFTITSKFEGLTLLLCSIWKGEAPWHFQQTKAQAWPPGCTKHPIYQTPRKKLPPLLPCLGWGLSFFLFKRVTLDKTQGRRPLRPLCWWRGLRNIPPGIFIRQDYQIKYIINWGLYKYSYQQYHHGNAYLPRL